jgi:23S rRNA (uracil1939-C5)-methyltransferase
MNNFNEKTYRENKQNYLQNLFGGFTQNISWIWIGKNSRRKVSYQVSKDNRLGYFQERSHNLIEIDEDELAQKEISALILPLKNFLKKQEQNLFTKVAITAFDNCLDVIFAVKRSLNFTQVQNLINFARANNLNVSSLVGKELTPILLNHQNQIFYPNFKINLSGEIFIQATKEGLENITKIISQNLENAQNIVDFYAGFGAYSFAIINSVKSILAIEGDEKMTELIKKNAKENNLNQKITAQVRDLFFNPLQAKELKNFDLAIINPPRNGCETQIAEIAKSNLKKVIYVSCNPQSAVRDAKILIDFGFKLTQIQAIDQFYQTNHLELVAIFEKK